MTESRPPVPIEILLQHASWVRGLAFRLVRDPDDAEDLVQDTLLNAVRHPPRDGGDQRSWLRRVMINTLRMRRRADTARAEREAYSSADKAPPRPDELVERADTLRRLTELVVALPEPYRASILMRHFEELSTGEIAARTATPVETVRTRLKRAYEMLREGLEGAHGTDWRLALVPLLNWPRAAEVPPPRAPLVRPAIVIAAGLALVAAMSLWIWSARDAPPQVAPAPATRDSESSSSVAPRSSPGRRPGGAAASAAADDATPGTAATTDAPPAKPIQSASGNVALVGTIETDGGPPPATLHLRLTALVAAQTAKDPDTRDVTVSAGAIAADLPLADKAGRRVIEWDVQIDHADYLPFSTRVRMPFPPQGVATVRMDPIRLRRAGYVSGSVAFEPANPGDVATVGTIPVQDVHAPAFDTVTAAPGARFRVRANPGAKMLVAAVANDRVPVVREIQVDPGTEKDVGVLVLAEGVRVSGRVGTNPRLPLAGKPIVALVGSALRPFSFGLGERQIGYDGTIAWTYHVKVPVDAEGRFTAGGLLPGTFTLMDYAAAGVPYALQNATLKPFEAPTEHADFEYTGTVVRVVFRRGGAGVPGVRLDFGASSGATSGEDGVARILGQPGATYTADVRVKGSPSSQLKIDVAATGGAADVTIDLPEPAELPAPATWTVTMRPSSGEAPRIAGVGFFAVTDGRAAIDATITRDVASENGVFKVEGIPPGRWRIEVRPGAGWFDPSGFLVAAPVERELAPGEKAHDEIPLSPGGRLVVSALEADGSRADRVACKVYDAAHREVPVAFGSAWVGVGYSINSAMGISSLAPADVFPALPPGTYTVDFDQYPNGALVRRSAAVEVVAGRVAEAVVRFPPR